MKMMVWGAVFAASMVPVAAVACCPSGGTGSRHPMQAKGLGESAPQAADLSTDPRWSVYEFTRDGINYLQINDSSGTVRAAVGSIDSIVWVMPIGSDVESVNVAPSNSVGTVIYRSDRFIVKVVKIGKRASWVIEPVSTR